MNHKKNREIICLNCGRKGHIYKKCHLPIVSFGIICVKINNLDLSQINLKDFLLLIIKENYYKKNIFIGYII